jgi:pimeloyl-ACP methyl ester carboxylesterase
MSGDGQVGRGGRQDGRRFRADDARVAGLDGVALAVRGWPRPDPAPASAPDLLLIHGLASSSHIWDLVAPILARRHRVFAYDQRGHGESSKPASGYGFDRTAPEALAVARALRLQRPVLVGHSFGAHVALEAAVRSRRSVSGIVLVDGGFRAPGEGMDWPTVRGMLAPPDIDGLPFEEFLAGFRRIMAPLPVTSEMDQMALSLVRVGRDGRIRRRLSVPNHLKILRAMWGQRPRDLLRSIRVPALVLAARERPIPPEREPWERARRESAAEIRRIGTPVEFEWIDGIHDVPLQRPAAVAGRIERFAARAVGR